MLDKGNRLKLPISIKTRTSVIWSCFKVSHTVFSGSKADEVFSVQLVLQRVPGSRCKAFPVQW